MRRAIPWILAAATLTGCAAAEEPRKQLTERERHEAIAQSSLPGAAGVGHALSASDSATARARQYQQALDPVDSSP